MEKAAAKKAAEKAAAEKAAAEKKAAEKKAAAELVAVQMAAKKEAAAKAAKAAAATASASPTFNAADHIASMSHSAIVLTLLAFGHAAAPKKDESMQRAKLVKLIGTVAESDWPSTLQVAVLRAATDFLAQHLKLETAARTAAKLLQDCKASVLDIAAGKANSSDLQSMWQRLLQQYCPPAPTPDDLKERRRGVKILAIGPGFGFRVNKAQIAIVERAFGAENVYQLHDPRYNSATYPRIACEEPGEFRMLAGLLCLLCLPIAQSPLSSPITPVAAALFRARRMTASRWPPTCRSSSRRSHPSSRM